MVVYKSHTRYKILVGRYLNIMEMSIHYSASNNPPGPLPNSRYRDWNILNSPPPPPFPSFLSFGLNNEFTTPSWWQIAFRSSSQAFEFDANSEKGFFRRGQAYFGKTEYELAKQDFEKVLELSPDNKAAKNQVSICNQKIKQQAEKEKRLYKNMFDTILKENRDKVRASTTNHRRWSHATTSGFIRDSSCIPGENIFSKWKTESSRFSEGLCDVHEYNV